MKHIKKIIIALILLGLLAVFYSYEVCRVNIHCKAFVRSMILENSVLSVFLDDKKSKGNVIAPQEIVGNVESFKNSSQYRETLEIHSAHNSIYAHKFELPSPHRYGAIATFKDTFIFLDAVGKLFLFDRNNKSVQLKETSTPILNFNKKEFEENFGDNEDLNTAFAVKGLVVFKKNKKNYLVASTLAYDVDNNCHTVSVYKSEIFEDDNNFAISDWKNIYKSVPCLVFKQGGTASEPGAVFNTISSGGKVQQYDDDSILLTIGDLENNGLQSPDLVQDMTTHYGKIIKINVFNKKNKIFSIGHRNPQGLYINKDKNVVFETEHGPWGGDEVNIIKENKNYGWPLRIFGVNYDVHLHRWFFDKSDRTHSGYEKPIMSWVPSIAISNLIQIKTDHFNYWKDDLIVSSLKDVSLYRLHLDNYKVITIETIYIGQRIRDIIELGNGEIVLLTEDPKDWNDKKHFIILNYFKPL